LATTEGGAAAAARDSYATNKQRRKGGVLKKSLKAKNPKAAGTRSETDHNGGHRSKGQQASSKPMVRFADKKKRTLKGKHFQRGGGGGGVKRQTGGQVFRRRAKAS
jgi:hypothetical protein